MLTRLFDERLIHSFKTLIACMIGVALARFSNLPSGQWIVITICVVMCSQLYVGSVLQKSYLRFLGTLVGCLFAIIAILISPNVEVAIWGAIAVSAFVFSYIATGQEKYTYTGTLGAVTTTIIMLSQQTPTTTTASERFLEISVGILIASLVSQFIFPIHARTHLRRAQAKTLGQLRDYYIATTTGHDPNQEVNYHELDETIIKSLLKQRQLAQESTREPLGMAFSPAHFSRTLYHEREMLRAITFMRNALKNIKAIHRKHFNASSVTEFNQCIVQAFNDLIEFLNKSKSAAKTQVMIPSLDKIKSLAQPITQQMSQDEKIYLDGLLFSAEIFTQSLAQLTELYNLSAVRVEIDAKC